jgi:hypothetical protein
MTYTIIGGKIPPCKTKQGDKMGTKAKNSIGTKFYVETTVAGTYIAVEEMLSIPKFETGDGETIDVTNMDSGDYRELIASFKTPNKASFEANYSAEHLGQARILELKELGTKVKFKLVFPNNITPTGTGLTYEVEGSVLGALVDGELGKQLILKGNIQFSGKPTVTAES